MGVRQQLIFLLEQAEGHFLSGNTIARQLGVSRTAVWNQIRQLEAEGYAIEAIRNRGYRLSAENDIISESSVLRYLGDLSDIFSLQLLNSVDSTNTWLRARAAGLPQWYAVIAGTQTAGRGRGGRNFYSPAGSGLYLSVLLRPGCFSLQPGIITSAAAVAVCRAVEECTGLQPGIKWVNDVFLDGKKICGILTEASVDLETGSLEYAIAGIGLNVCQPPEGFPPELQQIVGALYPQQQGHALRSRLAASILRHLYTICTQPESSGFLTEYRARSILPGRDITVIRGTSHRPARALGIDPECRLLVQYSDGTQEALSYGEVSIRPPEDSAAG